MRRMFIVNSQAGRGNGQKCGKEIEELQKRGEIEGDIVYTKEPGDETILAEKAVSEGYDCLVSVGGEGTNNGVINGMVGSEAIFGMIPGGMANDLARSLGIPTDVKGALNILKQGKIIQIDLGKVSGKANERVFLNEVSFGFSARIIQFTQDFKKQYKILPTEGLYLVTLLKTFSQLEYPEIEVAIPGANILRDKITLALVANGQNCGGMFKLAPQADLTDGLLDICLIRKIGIGKILKNLLRAREGTHLKLPEVWTLPEGNLPKASFLTISSSQELCSEMDGEILPAEKEYEISIFPKARRVIVP